MKDSKYIGGIDEVGRGALAGPIVAALVVRTKKKIPGISDSKSLSDIKRRELFSEVLKKWHTSIGTCSSLEVDKFGVKKANYIAMQRALLSSKIALKRLLVDGCDGYKFPIKSIDVISGDKRVEAIAAASIIAKVFRDNIMQKYHKIFSIYHFDKNKGYGTSLHINAIKEHGLCPWHRQTYLKKINGKNFNPNHSINTCT